MGAKRSIAAVWAVALLLSAAAIAQPSSRVDLIPPAATAADAVDAVAQALKAGDVAFAERLASLALDRRDLDAGERLHVLLNRGVARERQGKRAAALEDFTKALGAKDIDKETRARALFDRGIVHDEMGKLKDAVADYGAAIDLSPTFPAALNNRANALRRLGRLAEAKRDYEASLAGGNTMPQYSEYGLGQIAEKQGRLQDAELYYRKALAANPQYTLAQKRLAALGESHGRSGAVAWKTVRSAPAAESGVTKVSYDGGLTLRPAMDSVPRTQVAALNDPPAAATATASGAAASEPQNFVQLAAYRAEADAAFGWNHMVDKAGGLLDGLTPVVVSVDIPGRGRFYRLRTGPVDDAGTLCEQLKSHGLACIPVKG